MVAGARVLHRGCLFGALAGMALIFCLAHPRPAKAEYGDIVINNFSDGAGMRPAVFPHWFHRIRYTCKVCHADLGFKFQAGGNQINMLRITEGEFCGACHNGTVAWSAENCNLCHSAKLGTVTQVHESTFQHLIRLGPIPASALEKKPK